MTLPRAVIFDWDNTLVDTWLTIHDALNQTFDRMGVARWDLAETKQRVRHSLKDSFPLVFGDAWQDARQVYIGAFEAIHLERLAPIAGAAALLEALHDDGRLLALVSNKTGRLLRREVEALGWGRWFHRAVGAGDAAADKPDRAPVDLALDGSGIASGQAVWLVGDTDVDMLCARNAGCIGVLVHGNADAFEAAAQPHLVFADFPELRRALLPRALATGVPDEHIATAPVPAWPGA